MCVKTTTHKGPHRAFKYFKNQPGPQIQQTKFTIFRKNRIYFQGAQIKLL